MRAYHLFLKWQKSQELEEDFLFKTVEEDNILRITSEGDKPQIKELFTCKLTDPSYAQTTAQLEEEVLYDIAKEGEYQDYIER